MNRRMRLIDQSFTRSNSHLTYRNESSASVLASISTVDTVSWIAVADEEGLLDPFGNAPMKLFKAEMNELPVSSIFKWNPPLLLSTKQWEINSQKGSVLLLGRSGTGKTYYLVNRMQNDARATMNASVDLVDNTYSQLFVTRSARLCELVKYLYKNDEDDEKNSSKRADFYTLEQFISHMESVSDSKGPPRLSQCTFPKNRNVDFPYFRDKIFPKIASKVCLLKLV